MRTKHQKGFTLMELMVVIVIVAILAAVAAPLYININYLRDAQRTEAKGAIGAVITAEQTNYQLNGGDRAATFIQNPVPGSQNGLNRDLTEALANWTIAVAAPDTTAGYLVTATGIGKYATIGTVTYDYKRATGVGTWTP